VFECSKVRNYSPAEASKVYNKPVTRKSGIKFNPHQIIDLITLGSPPLCDTESEREKIVMAYIEVRVTSLCLYIQCALNVD